MSCARSRPPRPGRMCPRSFWIIPPAPDQPMGSGRKVNKTPPTPPTSKVTIDRRSALRRIQRLGALFRKKHGAAGSRGWRRPLLALGGGVDACTEPRATRSNHERDCTRTFLEDSSRKDPRGVACRLAVVGLHRTDRKDGRSGRGRGGRDRVAAGVRRRRWFGGSHGRRRGRNPAPLGLHAGEPGSFAAAPPDTARVQHRRQPPARRHHQARRPVRFGDRAVRLSQRRRQHAAEPGRRRRFRARGDGAGQDRDRCGQPEELARLRPERDRRAGQLRDELHSQLRGARVPPHPRRRAGRRLSGALHEPQGGRVRGRDRARHPRHAAVAVFPLSARVRRGEPERRRRREVDAGRNGVAAVVPVLGQHPRRDADTGRERRKAEHGRRRAGASTAAVDGRSRQRRVQRFPCAVGTARRRPEPHQARALHPRHRPLADRGDAAIRRPEPAQGRRPAHDAVHHPRHVPEPTAGDVLRRQRRDRQQVRARDACRRVSARAC